MATNKTKKALVPKLRFGNLNDSWSIMLYGDIYSFYTTNSFSRDNLNYENGEVKNIHYGDIHTKYATLFNIQKEEVPFVNNDIDLKKIKQESFCQEKDLVIADASEDYADIGKTIELIKLNNEKIIAGLHTFLARPNKHEMAKGFAGYLVQSWNFRKQVMIIAQGTKVLSLSTGRLAKVKLHLPTLPEQQKIAAFLSAVDEKIQLLTRKKELLEQYKKGVMQQLLTGKLRFKDGNGKAYPKWEEKRLGDVLDYIQPTKYLVKSVEYDDSYDTPVLTAGKTFILGYTNETDNIFDEQLPVILFDDFTTATQFVDFPFKAKSSAMKILVPKINENIRYLFEVMQLIKFEVGGHGRHWISQFALLNIPYPCIEEQNKIASFLAAIDTQLENVSKQITQTQSFKKGLLQQMFV